MEEEGLDTLIQILEQINQLSGAALDALLQGRSGSGVGSEAATGAPSPEQGAPPAPPEGV